MDHRRRAMIPIWVLLISMLLVYIPGTRSVDDSVKQSLLLFMQRLSPGRSGDDDSWGWNSTSDPCVARWKGVYCDSTSQFVQRIVLESLNLTGGFDADLVCVVPTLKVISLKGNNLTGGIPGTISSCKRLTHLYLTRNHLSGQLPDGLSKLKHLNWLDVSNNAFSGGLPSLDRIQGLVTFLAQNNQLSGGLPAFKLASFKDFNVSNNNFTGPIPDAKGLFGADSFRGNPGLCGNPLPTPCPSSTSLPQPSSPSKKWSLSRFDIYFGYMIIGLLVLALVIYKITRKQGLEKEANGNVKQKESAEYTTTSNSDLNAYSSIHKSMENRSEFSITSADSGSVSLVVFPSAVAIAKDLKFEDLLRSPAELLGRGKNSTLYKVILNNGMKLVVKRIKNWQISPEDFVRRMQQVEQAKHPNVLAPIAFYCTRQEKLLVYQYHRNGNLFSLLHGRAGGEVLNWSGRLTIAAAISNGLAFMHSKLWDAGIPHGNIKSTNILFDEDAEPCLSEYGLLPVESRDGTSPSKLNTLETSESYSDTTSIADNDAGFEGDVYRFGIVILELLTGKTAKSDGQDLVKWVDMAVKEEWTGEVFDGALQTEGANVEKMVKLLQVALRCIRDVPGERPRMNWVAETINAVRDEEEREIHVL